MPILAVAAKQAKRLKKKFKKTILRRSYNKGKKVPKHQSLELQPIQDQLKNVSSDPENEDLSLEDEELSDLGIAEFTDDESCDELDDNPQHVAQTSETSSEDDQREVSNEDDQSEITNEDNQSETESMIIPSVQVVTESVIIPSAVLKVLSQSTQRSKPAENLDIKDTSKLKPENMDRNTELNVLSQSPERSKPENLYGKDNTTVKNSPELNVLIQPSERSRPENLDGKNNTRDIKHCTLEVKTPPKKDFREVYKQKVWSLSMEVIDPDVDDLDNDEAQETSGKSAGVKDKKIEKRMWDDINTKLSKAKAKLSATLERESALKDYVVLLEAELQSIAAIEAIIRCTDPQHGNSVLEPAQHLWKFLKYAFTKLGKERSDSLMKNTLSSLTMAAQQCGQDVSRLMFWWSNVIALRHAIMLNFNIISTPSPRSTVSKEIITSSEDSEELTEVSPPEKCVMSEPAKDSHISNETKSIIAAMEKLEAWIHSRAVKSLWCQAFSPATLKEEQQPLPMEQDFPHWVRNSSISLDPKGNMESNICIETWKAVFFTAVERLCPARAAGKQCCCVFGLSRLVMEGCVGRLDASMFNAIMPINDDTQTPTDIDTINDIRFIPIHPGSLTFTAGAELKNVVSTWSTWLTLLLEKLGKSGNNLAVEDRNNRQFISFPILKSVADLVLLLPKVMITDESVRKQVCPALSLHVIKQILLKFEPDDLSPEPIATSMLDDISDEIELEKRTPNDNSEQSNFSEAGVAIRPQEIYCLHSSSLVKDNLNGLLSTVSAWISSSDVVIEDLQTLLETTLNLYDDVIPREQRFQHPTKLLRFNILKSLLQETTST